MKRGAVWPGRSVVAVATVCGLAAPAAAVTPTTERVNVSSTGEQIPSTPSFDPESSGVAVSGTGQFVAFTSRASNLVAGDTNGAPDVFVRDRVSGQTERVSVSSTGAQANSIVGSVGSAISPDGRFVVFESGPSNLDAGDTNGRFDVFVRDRVSGQTERVSVSSAGRRGNADSHVGDISPDGRFVSFVSEATNLVPGDTNVLNDVFVHNRITGQTRRVNVSSAGAEASRKDSGGGEISADGRFVVVTAGAPNLVRGDTNQRYDAFVRDRATRQTRRVSVSSTEDQANGISVPGGMSADGRFVTFTSTASNLVARDTNGVRDVFVRDRSTGLTRRVSVPSAGGQAISGSTAEGISADGRFVLFTSRASNLVPGDTNGRTDVFVRDRSTGETRRVSVSSTGAQANDDSGPGAISADGRFIAFDSWATNLVEGDTNIELDVFIRGPLQ